MGKVVTRSGSSCKFTSYGKPAVPGKGIRRSNLFYLHETTGALKWKPHRISPACLLAHGLSCAAIVVETELLLVFVFGICRNERILQKQLISQHKSYFENSGASRKPQISFSPSRQIFVRYRDHNICPTPRFPRRQENEYPQHTQHSRYPSCDERQHHP